MALLTAAVKMAIGQTLVRIHSTENTGPYIVRARNLVSIPTRVNSILHNHTADQFCQLSKYFAK